MNEEQVRRIIREEIRSALKSLADNANYETERVIGTSFGDLMSQEAFRMKVEELKSTRVVHNSFECQVHDYVWEDDEKGYRVSICIRCGREEK